MPFATGCASTTTAGAGGAAAEPPRICDPGRGIECGTNRGDRVPQQFEPAIFGRLLACACCPARTDVEGDVTVEALVQLLRRRASEQELGRPHLLGSHPAV